MLKVSVIFFLMLVLAACQSKKPELVIIETDYGNITIQVDYSNTPKHAENFIKLVKEGFYDGLKIHRIISGVLIQTGDPNTRDDDPANDGIGGPGYHIPYESGTSHLSGAVGAPGVNGSVNRDEKSNGSQFYICLSDIPNWDDKQTVFGHVVENLDVVNKISWEPMDLYNFPKNPIYIKRAYIK